MNRLFVLILFILAAHCSFAQQIFLEAGKSISSFDYSNSSGDKLKNLTGGPQTTMALGYRMPVAGSLHLSGGASYTSYAAKGFDETLSNSYAWDFTMAGISLGTDYEFLRPEMSYNSRNGISFFVKALVSGEWLIYGTQNLNNRMISMKGLEQFDRPVLFIKGGAGMNYYLSKSMAIYLQYLGGKSFLIPPGAYAGEEALRFANHQVSLGFSVIFIQNKR